VVGRARTSKSLHTAARSRLRQLLEDAELRWAAAWVGDPENAACDGLRSSVTQHSRLDARLLRAVLQLELMHDCGERQLAGGRDQRRLTPTGGGVSGQVLLSSTGTVQWRPRPDIHPRASLPWAGLLDSSTGSVLIMDLLEPHQRLLAHVRAAQVGLVSQRSGTHRTGDIRFLKPGPGWRLDWGRLGAAPPTLTGDGLMQGRHVCTRCGDPTGPKDRKDYGAHAICSFCARDLMIRPTW
jgi:hypothetical protein